MRLSLRRAPLLVALAAAVSLIGCGDDDDITGAYSGNVQLAAFGINLSIPLTVNLSQSGSSLSGDFVATQPTGTTNRGSVSGSVNGSVVKLSLSPTTITATDCPATLDGTLSGKTISGTATVSCPGQPPVPGTFTISRQS